MECVYVCMCVYTCICVCLYVCVYTCIGVCVFLCVFVYVCAYASVCVGVCMCVCVHMHVFVCARRAHPCHWAHRDVKGHIVWADSGVCLQPCHFTECTQVLRLGGKCLNLLSHLISPESTVLRVVFMCIIFLNFKMDAYFSYSGFVLRKIDP